MDMDGGFEDILIVIVSIPSDLLFCFSTMIISEIENANESIIFSIFSESLLLEIMEKTAGCTR